MIYLTISDNSVESIQTKKDLLGREKIIATSQKNIPEGIITGGIISDPEKFQSQLQELFSSAYPKSIDDTDISLAISDKQILTYRLCVDESSSAQKITENVVQEAKKYIPYDPAELENFYKILPSSQSNKIDILYTAMTQNTIGHLASFFEKLGGKLTFLSSNSFGIFELVKRLINKGDKVLYATVEPKSIEYYILDENGPVLTADNKIGEKTHQEVLKEIVTHSLHKHKISITHAIIGGKTSIEINANQLGQLLQIPVSKMGDLAESLLKDSKVEMDAGGHPKFLFACPVGLFLLSKDKSAPNFIKDVDLKTTAFISTKDKAPEMVKKEVPASEESVSADLVIESPKQESEKPMTSAFTIQEEISHDYKQKKGLRWILVVIAIIVSIFVAAVIFVMNNQSFMQKSLPLLGAPTPTPTITPTITPTLTPTIDPQLKRTGVKVSVENGTQKTGYAKEIATLLEQKGYKNVDKSNADKDTYEQTQIRIKKSKENYLTLFLSDIKDKFTNPSISQAQDDEKFDIVIILGLQ